MGLLATPKRFGSAQIAVGQDRDVGAGVHPALSRCCSPQALGNFGIVDLQFFHWIGFEIGQVTHFVSCTAAGSAPFCIQVQVVDQSRFDQLALAAASHLCGFLERGGDSLKVISTLPVGGRTLRALALSFLGIFDPNHRGRRRPRRTVVIAATPRCDICVIERRTMNCER